MIDISPKQYGTYDCYLNNIIGPVSEYWNICHLPVLWAEFNFKNITKHATTLEDISITVGSRDTRTKIWREYCGISIENRRYDDYSTFLKIIGLMIQNEIPVGITIDSNYVPWNESSQIRPHCLLICGIYKDTFVCSDGIFHPSGICRINSKYLFSHYHELLLIHQMEVGQQDFKLSLLYFHSILAANNPRKSEALKAFANSIAECCVTDLGKTAADISKSDFLLDLTEVCNSRHNFMNGVLFFNQTFHIDNFNSIVPDLDDLQQCWNALKGLYIKSVLTREKNYIDSAVHMLLYIEQKEGEITHRLLSHCGI